MNSVRFASETSSAILTTMNSFSEFIIQNFRKNRTRFYSNCVCYACYVCPFHLLRCVQDMVCLSSIETESTRHVCASRKLFTFDLKRKDVWTERALLPADVMCACTRQTPTVRTAVNGRLRKIAFLIRLLRLAVNSCAVTECLHFDKGFLVKLNNCSVFLAIVCVE